MGPHPPGGPCLRGEGACAAARGHAAWPRAAWHVRSVHACFSPAMRNRCRSSSGGFGGRAGFGRS
eukprot:2006827-Alexandrium_andersonii.AAC.1